MLSFAHCRRASSQGGEQTLARKVNLPRPAQCDKLPCRARTRSLRFGLMSSTLNCPNQLPGWRTTVDGRYADRAWALVRLLGEPLGLDVLEIPAAGLSSEAVTKLVLDRRLPHVGQILDIDGSEVRRDTVCVAARTKGATAFSRAHDEFIARAPRCSVVVCTRDRPDDLRRCLTSLAIQDHPNFAVWVVDNAPANGLTRQIVESADADMEIHYVAEPRPGLSRARNKALKSNLEGDVVAWLDDDEVADSLWLTELTRAFDGRSEVVAASGVVVPAELNTQAQVWFEQFGGHSKAAGSRPTGSPRLPPAGSIRSIRCRHLALARNGGTD